MKVYTRTGDGGKTSLFSGERVPKHNDLIEAYGTVDELNSYVGGVCSSLRKVEGAGRVLDQLETIQTELFNVGARLATTPGSEAAEHLPPWSDEYTTKLERHMDELTNELDELRFFILPGGHQSAVWAHVARTVCRRAERCMLKAFEGKEMTEIDHQVVMYVNRLSDYLFVLARYCNHLTLTEETVWQG